MLSVQESFSRFTPLGIRFWDPVSDCQIIDGLRVTARAVIGSRKKVSSVKTRGNIYTLSNLPGLHQVETGAIPLEEAMSLDDKRQYVIEIKDSLNRYLDVAFMTALPLPYRGLFLSDGGGSPAANPPKGFYLYSSVKRRLAGNYAQVRGELRDQSTGEPAAHALVKVLTDSGETWFGLADADGQFVLAFPFPDLSVGFGGSPATTHVPLHEQSWNVGLEVAYSPETLESLAETDIPNYTSILNQSTADIFPSDPEVSSSPVTQLSLLLEFNKTTVARTDGQSYLLVSPSVS
ncbi:MAG TPA: hypothetical protein VF268_10900 [Gammaproteobacteria bacterium]